MSIKTFFQRKNHTAVFVDFEHWCYSLHRLYALRPRIEEFYTDISKNYTIDRIYFFGDFTEPRLRSYVDEIRRITNTIIDTQNPSSHIKKDYTDFIMLDYIYQDADQYPKTDTYIIFSGDGHFSSAASYLKVRKGKKIVVYGISNATSGKLKALADKCFELPTMEQERQSYYQMIIDNMDYVAKQSQKRAIYPTFKTTVQAVSRLNNISEDQISIALQELMEMGIITQEIARVAFAKQIKVLRTNWELAVQNGLWSYDRA